METLNLKRFAKSHVHMRHYDRQNKLIGEQYCSNSVTYAAAAILMTALLRSGPSQVTHLYARFGDSGANPGFLVPPNSDIAQSSRSTFTQSSNAAIGGLWVPILSAPAQTTTAAPYSGNKATFFFRIPYNISTDQVLPANNFSADTSYIYALGLGVAKVMSDRSQDLILSTLQAYGYDSGNVDLGYFSKFPIANGGQTSIDYSLEFTLE